MEQFSDETSDDEELVPDEHDDAEDDDDEDSNGCTFIESSGSFVICDSFLVQANYILIKHF